MLNTVRNDRDLRVAYEILQILHDKPLATKNNEKLQQHIVRVKRAIREYLGCCPAQEQVVRDDGDSLLVVFPLPDHLETAEDATAYFLDNYFREVYPSAYDCTGQIFTTWYKIFRRRGQFWAYHATAMDV